MCSEPMEQKIRRDRNMGDNLRRLRGMHGLSQEKLCVQLQRMGCDIGRTTYAKYEAGGTEHPRQRAHCLKTDL